MRVNLQTEVTTIRDASGISSRIALTIRPSVALPGEYSRPIERAELLAFLRNGSDLPQWAIKDFELTLRTTAKASLRAVNLSDAALEELGYFVD